MTYQCEQCGIPVNIIVANTSEGLCHNCTSEEVIATDVVIGRIDFLKQTIEAQDREIAMLREQLDSRPPKLQDGQCPDCGCIGIHGCVGKWTDPIVPREFGEGFPQNSFDNSAYESARKLGLTNEQFWGKND